MKGLSNHPILLTAALAPSVAIPLKDFLYGKLSKIKGTHFRKGMVGEGSKVNCCSIG